MTQLWLPSRILESGQADRCAEISLRHPFAEIQSRLLTGRYSNAIAFGGPAGPVVNRTYACASQNEVRQITSHRTDLTELQMVEDGAGYYLVPRTLGSGTSR